MRHIIRLFLDDLSVYREGILAQGFWALEIHRFGRFTLRIRPRPLRAVFRAVHIFLSKLSEIAFGISLPAQAQIGRRLLIEHFGGIIVHGSAVIGDDCIIRQGVTIGMSHRERYSEAPRIGDRVDIGAGAKLLGGISIGDDAAIGANAVVLHDVPANHAAVGVPAVNRPRRNVPLAEPIAPVAAGR